MDKVIQRISDILINACTDDVQGICVSEQEPKDPLTEWGHEIVQSPEFLRGQRDSALSRQQAASPMPPTSTVDSPAPKVHRDAFRYREAEDDGPRCRTCIYFRDRDSEVGDCQLYQSLTKSEPDRYGLVTVVAPEMVCEAWEQRPEAQEPIQDANLSSASGTLFS